MLVVDDDRAHLVAAVEFKSQKGPSFGNHVNNRTEKAPGNATDPWTAHREGALVARQPGPWLGWLMLVEECAVSRVPVAVMGLIWVDCQNFSIHTIWTGTVSSGASCCSNSCTAGRLS